MYNDGNFCCGLETRKQLFKIGNLSPGFSLHSMKWKQNTAEHYLLKKVYSTLKLFSTAISF